MQELFVRAAARLAGTLALQYDSQKLTHYLGTPGYHLPFRNPALFYDLVLPDGVTVAQQILILLV